MLTNLTSCQRLHDKEFTRIEHMYQKSEATVLYRRCHEKTYVFKAKLWRGTQKLFLMVSLN